MNYNLKIIFILNSIETNTNQMTKVTNESYYLNR